LSRFASYIHSLKPHAMSLKKNLAVSESGFLFNPSTGDSYSLNPIGAELLHLLQQGQSDEEIIVFILDNYMIDRDTAEKGLYDFKRSLRAHKLMSDE
jgi:hypothetical protein